MPKFKTEKKCPWCPGFPYLAGNGLIELASSLDVRTVSRILEVF